MPLLLYIAICLMAMNTVSIAQDQAHIHLGPVLGYRSIDAAFSSGGLEAQRTSDPSSTLATSFGVTLGASTPVSSKLDVRFDLEALWAWGSASTSRNVTFIVGGLPTPGVIRTDHDITTSWLVLDAGINWNVVNNVTLGFIVGTQFISTLDGTWTESIESPSGATFVSNGQSSRTFTNVSTNGALGSPSFIGGLDVGTRIPLAEKLDLTPALRFRYSLTEAVSGTGWHPFDIGLSVAVSLPVQGWKPSARKENVQENVQENQRENVPENLQERVFVRRSDTVTIVDAFVPGRVDTLWSTKERIGSDTIYTTYERHLPGPPPFLSTILDVTIDQNSVDTTSMVHIMAEIESEATTTTELRTVVDSVVTWTSTHLAKNIKQDIPLRTIIPGITARSTMSIEVHAITTDAYGQKKEAVPKRFVLKRLPASGRLQQQ